MEQLVSQMKDLDKRIDELVPVLVADEWQNVGERLGELSQDLTSFFQQLLNNSQIVQKIDIKVFIKSLDNFVFAVNIADTIQIADILLYEIRGMFRDIYRICKGED